MQFGRLQRSWTDPMSQMDSGKNSSRISIVLIRFELVRFIANRFKSDRIVLNRFELVRIVQNRLKLFKIVQNLLASAAIS